MSGVVLVTGASSGIGAAAAALLARRSFTVVGASRRPPADGAGHEWVAMDVRDEAQVRGGVEEILVRHGRLDALVCNAGFGIFGSIEEVSLARARGQFETNVFGTLAPMRAAIPHMRARRAGRIVVVGSLAGRAPIPFQAHYSMTKAAVAALVTVARIEVAPFGVAVSLVEPGDIKTAFNDVTDWGETGGSPYGERIGRCEAVIRRSLEEAPGPAPVARAIVRALTARRPRARYPVGPASWLVPIAGRLAPDRLAERLIRAHFEV